MGSILRILLDKRRTASKIARHMNADEKRRAAQLAEAYGKWVAWSFAAPVAFAFTLALIIHTGIASELAFGQWIDLETSPWLVPVAWGTFLLVLGVSLIVHIRGAIPRRTRMKEFLVATEWARTQGYTVHDVW